MCAKDSFCMQMKLTRSIFFAGAFCFCLEKTENSSNVTLSTLARALRHRERDLDSA
jgi:hypothetical protein